MVHIFSDLLISSGSIYYGPLKFLPMKYNDENENIKIQYRVCYSQYR